MTKFRVFVSERAVKTLSEFDQKTAARIKSALKELEADPFRSRSGADIKRLHGFEKPYLYRLRIGEWRVLYFVIDFDVKVTELIRRGKGYEWVD